jgi:hypothetical protein
MMVKYKEYQYKFRFCGIEQGLAETFMNNYAQEGWEVLTIDFRNNDKLNLSDVNRWQYYILFRRWTGKYLEYEPKDYGELH